MGSVYIIVIESIQETANWQGDVPVIYVENEEKELCQDQENGEKCVACRKAIDLDHLTLQ